MKWMRAGFIPEQV